MTSAKYSKLAVIATLCDHPDAEKYRQLGAISADNAIKASSQGGVGFKKSDLLVPDDDGKIIIDSPAVWKNFDKISKVIKTGGEKFTFEDFTAPALRDQRSLLDSARTHGGLAKVFSQDVWQGRYDEMERLWFKLPVPDRKRLFGNDGLISIDLKRKMFASEGKITPEERLAKAGLTPADVRQAFAEKGGFEELNAKLQSAGDWLRKEYILLRDSAGDTVFDNRSAPWGRYDAAQRIMREHGERFEVADFLKQVTYTKSILGRAAEHKALNRVFNPEHWAGRLPDMLSLWSSVLEGWKISPMTTHDFDNAYAETESRTYAKLFQEMKLGGKADLLKPLNAGAKDEKPVLPLGLKVVWENIDVISAQLAKQGEKLTMADLRSLSGQVGNTCFVTAVKSGYFSKVMEISKQSGEEITLDDFFTKDRHGNSVLGILSEKNQLSQVFSAQIWVGRIPEMKALWSQVPALHRHQVNFQQAETAAKQATLKQKNGGIKFKPRPDAQ